MMARCCICEKTLKLYNNSKQAEAQLKRHLNTHTKNKLMWVA